MIRDLIAIFGCFALAYCRFGAGNGTDRALTEAILLLVGSLVVTLYTINQDKNRRGELLRKLDKLELRNSYLETAIIQIGGDNLE